MTTQEFVLVIRTSAQVGPDEYEVVTYVKDVTGMTVASAMEWANKKCNGKPIDAKIIEVEQD